MRRLLLLVLLSVWMAIPAAAQQNLWTLPPYAATISALPTCSSSTRQGLRYRVGDGADATDCTTGSGSTVNVCECDGSGWVAVDPGVYVGANAETILNSTDGTFDFTRDDTGTVTITASDNNNNASLTVAPGAVGAFTLGTTSTTDTTVLGDDTGDAELVLVENSVGPDDIAAMVDSIVLCGQLVDVGNVQTFIGPSAAAYLGSGADTSIGSTVCDALDSETESTADAPIASDFPAFKVNGFWCRASGVPTNNDMTLTLRTAEGNAVTTDGAATTLTCTMTGGADTSCSTTAGTTTDIATGATLALQADYSDDLDALDLWCKVYFSVK